MCFDSDKIRGNKRSMGPMVRKGSSGGTPLALKTFYYESKLVKHVLCLRLRIGSHGRHLGDGKLHQHTKKCPLFALFLAPSPFLSSTSVSNRSDSNREVRAFYYSCLGHITIMCILLFISGWRGEIP